METGAVGSGTSTAPTTHTRTDRGLGSLKSEDFFRLLVTELQQQDPLEPTKTADMIGQVSQLRSIEISGRLTEALDSISRNQRTTGTGELLGKYVFATTEGADGTNQIVSGVVAGVSFNETGDALLELDTGQTVSASNVQRVTTLQQAEAEGTAVPPAQIPSSGSAATARQTGGAGAGHSPFDGKSGASARGKQPDLLDWLRPKPKLESPRRLVG